MTFTKLGYPVFSHVQVYVALSLARKYSAIHVKIFQTTLQVIVLWDYCHSECCQMLWFIKVLFVWFWLYKQYYPSSNQFRDPPTYTHQPSMQQKVPFSLISCSSSKVAFCSCVEWGWHIYNIVESESDPLTRRAVDLFEKEPLKGNSEVHLHTPTKFGEDRSKDLGGDREQTDRQTNRQTDKRCSIYSMICCKVN